MYVLDNNYIYCPIPKFNLYPSYYIVIDICPCVLALAFFECNFASARANCTQSCPVCSYMLKFWCSEN